MTGRIASLVDQILDVTHLDADPLVLERRPVSIVDLVARLRGDLALTGQSDRLVVELDPDLPTVDVDAGRSARYWRTSSRTRSSTRPAGRRS